MLLQFCQCTEAFRLTATDIFILGLETHRVDPRLHRLGITHRLDTSFELLEWNLRETLLVMTHETCLILMIVRWSEQLARHSAAVHEGKVPLRRIHRLLHFLEQ